MKFDKETILVLVVCTILLFAWPSIVTKIWGPPPEDKKPPVTEQTEQTPKADTPDAQAPEKVTQPKTLKKVEKPEKVEAPQVIQAPSVKKLEPVSIENDSIKVTIDPNAGKITAVELKKYFTSDPNDFKKTEDNIVLLKKFTHGALQVSNKETWTLVDIQLPQSPQGQVKLVRSFTTEAGAHFSVTQNWQLKDKYTLQFNLEIANLAKEPLTLDDLRISAGGLPNIHELANDKAPFRENHEISYCDAATGKVHSRPAVKGKGFFGFFKVLVGSAPKNPKKETFEEELKTNTSWVGVANKYFTCILVPEKSLEEGIICRATVFDKEKPEKRVKNFHVVEADALVKVKELPADTKLNLNFEYFAGPKKMNLLAKLDKNAPKIMKLYILGMTFFEFISRWMLSALLILQNFCGSYGLSIIILTLIVKTLLWPVTHRANVSMRKMQRINPLIQEIRKKYKDDSQKINMEMMKLYKEHQVNPLGGCLPILLQMPIFFALYAALSGAVEPRHTAFLWINDLTLPDTVGHIFSLPINPLMITMATSMFLQQKLTPSAADPAQQKMMMFMPVLMLVMLYSLPSGLTLYWTVSQLISIGQLVVNKELEKRAEAKEAKK